MRVLFGKFHFPSFICFCKPSPHLLSPSPLKLENTPHVPAPLSSVSDRVGQFSGETIEVKKENFNGNQVENFPKSSLKKPSSESGVQKKVEKARVQWMDFLGKELVEIKEFEPRNGTLVKDSENPTSETGDSDDERDGSQGCVCVIQ